MITLESAIANAKKIIPGKPVAVLLTFFCSLTATVSVAQNAKDTNDGLFHDDLLEHFVGKWSVSSVAHGKFFEQGDLEARWVMNHQYLRIQLQGVEIVPRLGIPIEVVYFVGYNHNAKRYVVHELSAFGGDHPNGGFCYARRDGNALTLAHKFAASADTVMVQRFTWKPDSVSWRMVSHLEISGKAQEPFLDLKAIPAAPATPKKPSEKSGE